MIVFAEIAAEGPAPSMNARRKRLACRLRPSPVRALLCRSRRCSRGVSHAAGSAPLSRLSPSSSSSRPACFARPAKGAVGGPNGCQGHQRLGRGKRARVRLPRKACREAAGERVSGSRAPVCCCWPPSPPPPVLARGHASRQLVVAHAQHLQPLQLAPLVGDAAAAATSGRGNRCRQWGP